MPLYQSDLAFPLISRGKVRDIYEVPEGVLLVATDRLSAFDVVFSDPIPYKGQVLNQISAFWFEQTRHIVRNHLISADPEFTRAEEYRSIRGRSSVCVTTEPMPVECVVRGYLEGSAWKDYQASRTVSGITLPDGLSQRSHLAFPIFTPSTKAAAGHDEPISFDRVVDLVGVKAAEFIRTKAIELYRFAHDLLISKGIVLSDTKFEFGTTAEGEIILIDEALTPDSSRFWEADSYKPGATARSMDKQFVRDYLETLEWNKKPPAPPLPPAVIENTTARYVEIFEKVTGSKFEGVDG